MKDYRKFVNLLKKCFPEHKVSVRRVRMPLGVVGDCLEINKKQQKFRIRIDRTLDEENAVTVLTHEYSHVISYEKPGSDHGPAFGLAFSKIYRIYLKYYIQEEPFDGKHLNISDL